MKWNAHPCPGDWKLLGFDARFHGDCYAAKMWTPEWRAVFLLRESVDWPLSADVKICPSIFALGPFDKNLGLRELPTPLDDDYDGAWSSLPSMRRRIESEQSVPKFLPIAIEILVTEQLLQENCIPAGLYDDCDPKTPPEGSVFLGYDVCDSGCTSGLSDCGYTVEEKQELVTTWAPCLNDFHLFPELDDAIAFQPVCNQRVKEHAPFYAYRIQRLPVS
jgi:hypothetical protein